MEDEAQRAALLELARQGDRGAFDRLQREVEPLLRRFLRHLLPGSPQQDDVLQSAFLSLYTNLERIEGEAHLLPFLYRVVRNLAYDELRRRGRYRMVEFTDATAPPGTRPGRGSSPDEAVERAMLAAEVGRALSRLPEAQRQALILYGQEGLTYEQVAEALAVDVGTVKSRIHYARQRLRAMLPADTVASLDTARDPMGGKRDERNR
jgi:RNA polymerase sigma-70 factor, ECF subfamily